jgi:hypothetical protein
MNPVLRGLVGDILQMTLNHPDIGLELSHRLSSIWTELKAADELLPEPDPPEGTQPVPANSVKSKRPIPKWPYKDTESYRCLVEKFHEELRHEDLLAVAKGLEGHLDPSVKLRRVHKRSKEALFKWFDDHWDTLRPLIEKVVLVPQDAP